MMPDMPPEPQHALPARDWDTAIGAAWVVLIGLGGTQITFNVADALRGASPSPVRILTGIAPVAAAVLLSHLASSRHAAEWFRWVVGAVMLVSMAVSIGATIQITAPALHQLWREIALGVTLDAASLLALWFIMDRHARNASAMAATEAAHAAVQAAESSVQAAGAEARAAIAEATGRAEAAAAEAAAAGEQLATVTGELATARAELHGLKAGMNKRRSSPVKSPRAAGVTKPTGSPVSDTADGGVNKDVDKQAEALILLAEDPEMSGPELGRRLGVSKSYGCRLKGSLSVAVADPETSEQ